MIMVDLPETFAIRVELVMRRQILSCSFCCTTTCPSVAKSALHSLGELFETYLLNLWLNCTKVQMNESMN